MKERLPITGTSFSITRYDSRPFAARAFDLRSRAANPHHHNGVVELRILTASRHQVTRLLVNVLEVAKVYTELIHTIV